MLAVSVDDDDDDGSKTTQEAAVNDPIPMTTECAPRSNSSSKENQNTYWWGSNNTDCASSSAVENNDSSSPPTLTSESRKTTSTTRTILSQRSPTTADEQKNVASAEPFADDNNAKEEPPKRKSINPFAIFARSTASSSSSEEKYNSTYSWSSTGCVPSSSGEKNNNVSPAVRDMKINIYTTLPPALSPKRRKISTTTTISPSQSSCPSTGVQPDTFTNSTTKAPDPPRKQQKRPAAIPRLNVQQAKAVNLATSGSSLFVTGPAGTGKSVVLKQIIQRVRRRYSENEWAVVAPTGTAAQALGGQTLHSFAGCGIPQRGKDFNKCWIKKAIWRDLKVLIIDEISMVSGEFWDCLSDVVTDIRCSKDEEDEEGNDEMIRRTIGPNWSTLPFGGLKLILCGDFLQLPPISLRAHEFDNYGPPGSAEREQAFGNRGFCFQARCWPHCKLKVIELTKVFRQDDGGTFVKHLHEIRKGIVTPAAERFLQRCRRPLPTNDTGIRPTILHATNAQVARDNALELKKIQSEPREFTAADSVEVNSVRASVADHPKLRQKLQKDSFFHTCIAQQSLTLKVGAQVMLIKNEPGTHPKRLVNGSRGVVVGYTDTHPTYGSSLVFHDLGHQKETPTMTNGNGNSDDQSKEEKTGYPLVRFRNGSTRIVGPTRFTTTVFGTGECRRDAVPLKLAYAVSIHKSQGMTLDYAVVDVSRVFTSAQSYVALSRASDENGLQLRGFSESVVRANALALEFYQNPDGPFPHWDSRRPSQEAEASSRKERHNRGSQAAPHIVTPGKTSITMGLLKGSTFIFSGGFRSNDYSRRQAESFINKNGGHVVDKSGWKKATYLVMGDCWDDGDDDNADITEKLQVLHWQDIRSLGQREASKITIIDLTMD